MIDIEKLTFADIGKIVSYKDESGELMAWNDKNIFVRYGDDEHSKATNPKDLKFIN